ncbi:unnamed protein product [Prorocentrum cordatum]|uniref:Ion transport domain-containing protein n=1 Tax=Prorocentrum cordatum TaxID=2364126 RepID=A0ABN9XYU7_9DINO|nr:unnamed protein product [Polarella glacialis]
MAEHSPKVEARARASENLAALGFEGLLMELDSLRARLLDQHRRELDDQRRESEAVNVSEKLSVLESEQSRSEVVAEQSCLPEGPEQVPTSGRLSLVTPEASESAASSCPTFSVLESWVSVVPICHLADPQEASLEPRRITSSSRTFEELTDCDVVVFRSSGFVSEWLMVHPSRWLGTLWSFLSLLLIAYDTITVPLYTFYSFSRVPGLIVFFDWVARFFWTFDIPLSFVTGFHKEGSIEMRPKLVALAYLHSWFCFDVLILMSDWLVVSQKDSTALTAIPVMRALRFVRVLRLLRLGRLSHMLNDMLQYASDGLTIVVNILMLTAGLCVGIHIIACIWYGVGQASSSGWVSNEALMESAALSEQYIFSVHWVITQLHGTSLTPPQTFLEISFQGLVLLGAHAFVAFFIANMTQAMICLTDTQNLQMQQASRRYLRRRRISPTLSYQLRLHFGKPTGRALQDVMDVENKMVQALPQVLQQKLYEEVRFPLLKLVPLFRRDGLSNDRLLRQLCCKAMSGISLISGELVFGLGDSCKRMLVVESGTSAYVKLNRSADSYPAMGRTLTNYIRGREQEGSDMRQVMRHRGQHISEAALWTQWTNQGEFFAEGDCTMLVMDNGDFASIVSAYEFTRVFALKYASCFVSWLNDRAREFLHSDVMETPKHLIQDYLQEMADDSAFAFISHFKEEAGSDAALIEEGMRRIIKENPTHPAFNLRRPIFLDSNDLEEMAQIPVMIRGSHNVVLLLTDNVLTRPWVLIEIVTALRAKLPIHLVSIQRPGVDFKFPSEDAIKRLAAGVGLSPSAQAVLRAEGITADDLTLLGNAFHRIALPFSPHKSAAVREAELLDIMNRCEMSGTNGSKIPFRRPASMGHPDFSSTGSRAISFVPRSSSGSRLTGSMTLGSSSTSIAEAGFVGHAESPRVEL